jgi:hypothetical protein
MKSDEKNLSSFERCKWIRPNTEVCVGIKIITCWVTVEGVWIDNRIYWTLLQLVTTLYTSLPHKD